MNAIPSLLAELIRRGGVGAPSSMAALVSGLHEGPRLRASSGGGRAPGTYPVRTGVTDVVGPGGQDLRMYSTPEDLTGRRQPVPQASDPVSQQLAHLRKAGILVLDPATGEERVVANVPGGGQEAFPVELDEAGGLRLGEEPGLMGRLAALIRGGR